MMRVNFNRSVNFLLISIALTLVGCSDSPQEPLSVYENQTDVADQDMAEAESEETAQDNQESQNYHHPDYSLVKPKLKSKTAGPHNTVWDRLLSLYSLPDINNERVERELNWYLDHPAYIARIQKRAEPYLHLILDEIERKNIPGELALLPVVESAFIPNAYSKADASGLWQFIPSTGYQYGLQQNSSYDGRRDIYASTKAATTFLKGLGESFDGDWFLALASYNYGKANVMKSMERNADLNLPTDYWSLNLPKETSDYVPRLIAIAKLFANADLYNIPLQHIPNKPYFEVVHLDAPLDLHKAAELAETPYDKFLKLNPGFSGSTTEKGPNRLLVPVEKAQVFKENLAQLPYKEWLDKSYQADILVQAREDEERARHRAMVIQARQEAENRREIERKSARLHDDDKKLVRNVQDDADKKVKARDMDKKPTQLAKAEPDIATVDHKVKAGETLSAIAARNHVSMKAIIEANHLKGNGVRIGMNLQIPTTKKAVEPVVMAKAPVEKEPKHHDKEKDSKLKLASNQTYAVKKGDTVSEIAEKFSVSSKNLAEWNKIKSKGLLPGQKITIKSAVAQVESKSNTPKSAKTTVAMNTHTKPVVTPKNRVVRYDVKQGDSINKIAQRFNVSVAELRKSNVDTLSKGLRPGQKLKFVATSS